MSLPPRLRSVVRRHLLAAAAGLLAIFLAAPHATARPDTRTRRDSSGKTDSTRHSRHSSRSSGRSSSGSRLVRTTGSRRHSRSRREPKQKAPTKDRIEEIQTALARDGYYHGDATGKWDPATVDAMKRFQQDNGLNPTGKLDATSLQKLGLGSDVAGLGAPRPAAPPADPVPQDKKPPSF